MISSKRSSSASRRPSRRGSSAPLVCKRWCRLVSDPGFRRRFHELHRTPPMLGFLCCHADDLRFQPTTSFCPPYADFPTSWDAVDARHGRILFEDTISVQPPQGELVVSSPITGKLWRLPMPLLKCMYYAAALLCATPGCNHLDCAGGPFRVVFLGIDHSQEFTSACVYSSEAGAWTEATSVQHPLSYVASGRVLLWGILSTSCVTSFSRILEYDLGNEELSVMSLPPGGYGYYKVLMTAEGGGLGFAMVQKSKLYVWSREDGLDGHAGWAQRRVIELDRLLPVCALSISTTVIATADGVGVVFVRRGDVFFTIDLKSGQARQHLGAACTSEGPSTGASSA